MKKMFRERDSFVLGLMFLVTVTLLVLAALNINAIADLQGRRYTAVVPEAAGLQTGDAVKVNGVRVGRVSDVRLADEGVAVELVVTEDDVTLGERSTAAIKVATVLGDKELALTSEGDGELAEGGTIPLSRTSAPYDLTTALETLTRKAGRLDTEQVSDALDVVSTTLEGAPDELEGALRGVERLSRTINSRDQEILALAERTEQFSGILADRSGALRRLVQDGNLLLAELERRKEAIGALLASITPLAEQMRGLVADNRSDIGPALDRLLEVIDVLKDNRGNLAQTLTSLSKYATGFGEAVASGRFFTANIANLLPGNLVPTSGTDLVTLVQALLTGRTGVLR